MALRPPLVLVAGARASWSSPFVWMLLGSFKPRGRAPPVAADLVAARTRRSTTTAHLFSRLDFGTYFINSAIVAVAVTAGNLLFCSMLGYALAMLDFRASSSLFVVVLATLMIPGVVTFVPLFVLVANAGLIDTLPGLILPFLVARSASSSCGSSSSACRAT